MTVVDVDSHIYEPEAIWDDYVPAGWAVVQMNPRIRGLMIMRACLGASPRRVKER